MKCTLTNESELERESRVRARRAPTAFLAALMLTLLCFGSASVARAEAPQCFGPDSGITTKEVSYVPPTNTYAGDPRSNNGVVHLMGWLYYKIKRDAHTLADAPVVIFNHGHEQERKQPCEIARYFVNQGFVVFAPLRRGHYGDGIASTGVYIDDYVGDCLRTYQCRPCELLDPATCTENAYQVDYLRQQYVDVIDQVYYIRNHPSVGRSRTGKLADPTRIAILGHSFGGALMVFANARSGLHNVAIDVSGAELSWGDAEPYWESELKAAIGDARRPIYFLQPKNGKSLAPTKVLFGESINRENRAQGSIFPPATWDSVCFPHNANCWDAEKGEIKPESKQAHSSFIGNRDQVELWGPSVIEFINRYPLSSQQQQDRE
ncbi:MAG TPA: hypothetical protein VM095_08860 [Pyrinomonadaceae bacterium]|nr:hypothetical protein [Pyrinomonadaceae bacterium]